MATLLTRIDRTPDQRKIVRYDVGRTLALTIISVLLFGGAIGLWAIDKGGPAYALFSLGEAVVIGGFGIAYGEKRGAISAGAESPRNGAE